jgi:hypothetical protein
MTTDVPATDRCPKCGAAVRFGDPWCTLCYTDLRPPAPPTPEPAPEPLPTADPVAYSPPAEVRGPDPLTAPLEAVTSPVTGANWPCAVCGTVNPMASDTCSACGRHFLAGVREDAAPLLELPVVGDITKLSRAQRFAVAFGVVFLFLLLTFLLGLIFG